jgi:Insertion element 4 transposase N-terminal
MAEGRNALPAKLDVARLISARVLASGCPLAWIEEVLAGTGKCSPCEWLLPVLAVVYYVMAPALRREVPLEDQTFIADRVALCEVTQHQVEQCRQNQHYRCCTSNKILMSAVHPQLLE